jgi:hypothetical protein
MEWSIPHPDGCPASSARMSLYEPETAATSYPEADGVGGPETLFKMSLTIK